MKNVVIDLDGLMVKVCGQTRRKAVNVAVKLYKHSNRLARISAEHRQMVENFLIKDA